MQKSKKYKQTKLDFGAGVSSRGASASTSRSDSPSSSGGRVTRRSVTKKTGSDRGSFFKRMGDRDTEHYRLGYPVSFPFDFYFLVFCHFILYYAQR